MKKILFLAAIIIQVFSACTSDLMDDMGETIDKPIYEETKYRFKIEADYWDWPYARIEVNFAILLEYNKQDEPIMQHRVESCYPGMGFSTFVASDSACKVKVVLYSTYYSMNATSRNTWEWAKIVYYLKKGGQIDIILADATLMDLKEP